VYQERLDAFVEELLREPPDPEGEVYSCLVVLFRSPNYLQSDALLAALATPARAADDPVAPSAEIPGAAEISGASERETNQAHQQEGQEGDAV
jgi:hypothetical protein